MTKICGIERWPETVKHYELLSYSKDDKGLPTVGPTDEAFLVLLWENNYKKWTYEFTKTRIDNQKLLTKDQKEENPEEWATQQEEMNTPYTTSKAGRMRFGGWNDQAKKKFSKMVKQIRKQRVENKDYIKKVEEAALDRIRKKYNRDQIDERRRKKRKKDKDSAGKPKTPDSDDEVLGGWEA